MTLEELLALLPDNDTGAIDAADLRTVVTELWQVANTQALMFVYDYATSAAPTAGKVNIEWALSATELNVSEQTGEGGMLPTALIDATEGNRFMLASGDRSVRISGVITGVSLDQGTYRTFTVAV